MFDSEWVQINLGAVTNFWSSTGDYFSASSAKILEKLTLVKAAYVRIAIELCEQCHVASSFCREGGEGRGVQVYEIRV